jgi:D-alanyl-D-alanine dipeptidase
MKNKELDTQLIQKLRRLGNKNKHEKYLEVLNEALEDVEINECEEAMLYLPNHLPDSIFINQKNKDVSLPYLRESIVDMLQKVQNQLPARFHLYLANITRTKEIVDKLYNRYKQKAIDLKNLSDKEADILVRNILAMPDDPVPPGHMTGAAIDVVLADDQGNLLPMKEDYNKIPREVQSFTNFTDLPEELLKNRKILYRAMTDAGFHNYFREFWHYSYGEAYWAVRRKDKTAIYGIPSKELFEEK